MRYCYNSFSSRNMSTVCVLANAVGLGARLASRRWPKNCSLQNEQCTKRRNADETLVQDSARERPTMRRHCGRVLACQLFTSIYSVLMTALLQVLRMENKFWRLQATLFPLTSVSWTCARRKSEEGTWSFPCWRLNTLVYLLSFFAFLR